MFTGGISGGGSTGPSTGEEDPDGTKSLAASMETSASVSLEDEDKTRLYSLLHLTAPPISSAHTSLLPHPTTIIFLLYYKHFVSYQQYNVVAFVFIYF